jgi:hypothetical protein
MFIPFHYLCIIIVQQVFSAFVCTVVNMCTVEKNSKQSFKKHMNSMANFEQFNFPPFWCQAFESAKTQPWPYVRGNFSLKHNHSCLVRRWTKEEVDHNCHWTLEAVEQVMIECKYHWTNAVLNKGKLNTMLHRHVGSIQISDCFTMSIICTEDTAISLYMFCYLLALFLPCQWTL